MAAKGPRRQKTIEETYQKLSQLDHILLRPDSYVGSLERQDDGLFIYDRGKESDTMTWKELRYVPGLYKIFDEILVNAADNWARDPVGTTSIKVEIDVKNKCVSVENNGQGLPIDIHKEHGIYVPDMVFGHLLTSDNYDDGEKKVTGGRNGYGAKLANIFSTKFIVECVDPDRQKKYVQIWDNNMKDKGSPEITSCSGAGYTKITFYPDLERFGMKRLDPDIVQLMSRRAVDIAGTTGKKCRIHLNKKLIPVSDFKSYVELYLDGRSSDAMVHEQCHERWEVAVTASDGQFQQVSFVNGIATLKGGTHVTHVAEQFIEAILKLVNSKNRGGASIRPHQVKSQLWFFVNCRIENPTFDSQTKETMTLKASKFGSTCTVSDAFIKKVIKATDIVDTVLSWAKAKEDIDLKKLKGGKAGKTTRLLSIPKLDDANNAGVKNGHGCTLIVTEGDSAKTLAVAGLSIIGRDNYGVFPLRGKVLNVRDASFKAVMNNHEISSITKILGLVPKQEYTSTQGLRYGRLMIMADQDFDGSHIKGLLLNLISHWWPSLFKLKGFLCEFVTPIVKASRRSEVRRFFTMPEYETWKDKNRGGRGWATKYYKGLGTSTTQEAKDYFREMKAHSLDFKHKGANCDELIDMAFNKKRADDRKAWINGVEDGVFVDHAAATLTYDDFVQKELVLFAQYSVMRAIPSVVDGLKPVQRKVLWSCFKRKLTKDIKVAQFAGYVSEHAQYHHGETSLQGSIITLAQTFVGSNNVNLLTPSGQFGTRLMGGQDHASARYIFTRLEPITRLIFHPDDDHIVGQQCEEGVWIEPEMFMPVIPLVLVNGAQGIATGYATFCPNFDVRDIVANLKRYLRSLPMREMCPCYRGFKGSLTPSADRDRYEVTGIVERRGNAPGGGVLLEITELPLQSWTQNYKDFLQSLMPTAEGSGQIEDFREYHTEKEVHFILEVSAHQLESLEAVGLEKALKLHSSLSMNNLMFFDREKKVKRYSSELEVMEDFAEIRLEYYHKRKSYLVAELEREHEVLSSKVRFIRLVISEELQVKNRARAKLVEELRSRGFRTLPEIIGTDANKAAGGSEATVGSEAGAEKPSGFDYLLGMRFWSLTAERVADIEKQLREKLAELEALRHTAVEDLWDRDLDAILAELTRSELAAAAASREEETALGSKRRGSSAARSFGKRPKSGSAGGANAPPLPPVPPLARRRPDAVAAALRELQARHLSKTHVARPGLFTDVVGEALAHPPADTKKRASTSGRSGGPAASPSKSPKASDDSSDDGGSDNEVAASPPEKRARGGKQTKMPTPTQKKSSPAVSGKPEVGASPPEKRARGGKPARKSGKPAVSGKPARKSGTGRPRKSGSQRPPKGAAAKKAAVPAESDGSASEDSSSSSSSSSS